MVERRRLSSADAKTPARGYFRDAPLRFIPSGCAVLDCVLGGGWPLGRISNVVGDKSVGKSLLAIEACANTAQAYPRAHIWYREAEAAFDVEYAARLGLPVKRVDFGPEGIDSQWDTVEDIFEDLDACVAAAEKSGHPGLYVLDSLDALSSRAELKRAIDKGSYGTDKASVMSELFRRLRKRIKRASVHVMIVSQLRDRIGITFGEKQTRTGGRALDFYASQIVWLHHMKILTASAGGVERATAVRVRARCKKNKVGPSFRDCEFVLRFGYGVDDLEASLNWLREVGMLERAGISARGAEAQQKAIAAELKAVARGDVAAARARAGEMAGLVRAAWAEVDERFAPAHRKYG